MKTDTSLLVVGGADEQVRAWGSSETGCGLTCIEIHQR